MHSIEVKWYNYYMFLLEVNKVIFAKYNLIVLNLERLEL
jgi:hypothetical protein